MRGADFLQGAILINLLAPVAIGGGQSRSLEHNPRFVVQRDRVFASDRSVTSIEPVVLSIAAKNPPNTETKVVMAQSTVSSMALHVVVEKPKQDVKWTMFFKTLGGVQQDSVSSESERGRMLDFWSADIKGRGVVVELSSAPDSAGLTVAIDSYDYPVVPSIPQAIWGKNEMVSLLAASDDIQNVGKAVARLRIKTGRGQQLCTGFLISDSLLITNYHCIYSDEEAVSAVADFGYDAEGATIETFRIVKLESPDSDTSLDYSVVRVEREPGKVFGHLSVSSTSTGPFPQPAPKLFLIEHPGGNAKMVSIMKCEVVSGQLAGLNPTELTDFGHHCDTMGGSSGSPVFAFGSNEVVGLHHIGFEEAYSNHPLENQAVFIGLIWADIQKRTPLIFEEIRSSH